MAKSTIQKCKCEHKFQDETYGKYMRVHNINENGDAAKCTVCGDKKSGKFKS